MSREIYEFSIKSEHIGPFFIYLGIGMLYAINNRAISPEIGIWTMGMPKVHEFLAENSLISDEVRDIFETFDELDAIQQLIPKKFNDIVSELMERLENELKVIENPRWDLEWEEKNRS